MARLVQPAGTVLAIEPTTWAFERLLRNASLNPFANIRFLKLALSDCDHGPSVQSFRSSYRLDGADTRQPETMLVKTLDTVLTEQVLDRVDLIKIDVDGYEGKVIRGSQQTLRRFRPHLILELSPSLTRQQGDDFRELVQTLQQLQYRFETEDGKPVPNVIPYCTARPAEWYANFLVIPEL